MPFKHPHPLYSVWQGMLRRCYTSTFKQFRDYGGRGIRVCERWKGPEGFKNFLADMGPRPDGYTLDRKNNDLDYSPDNCRWATRQQQQRNQRVTRRVTIEGVTYLAIELAEQSGLKADTIAHRASLGLSLAAVLAPEKRVFTDGLALGGVANGKRQRSKTHCPKGHEYSGDNLVSRPEGWRGCRECIKAKMRAYNAKKRRKSS